MSVPSHGLQQQRVCQVRRLPSSGHRCAHCGNRANRHVTYWTRVLHGPRPRPDHEPISMSRARTPSEQIFSSLLGGACRMRLTALIHRVDHTPGPISMKQSVLLTEPVALRTVSYDVRSARPGLRSVAPGLRSRRTARVNQCAIALTRQTAPHSGHLSIRLPFRVSLTSCAGDQSHVGQRSGTGWGPSLMRICVMSRKRDLPGQGEGTGQVWRRTAAWHAGNATGGHTIVSSRSNAVRTRMSRRAAIGT